MTEMCNSFAKPDPKHLRRKPNLFADLVTDHGVLFNEDCLTVLPRILTGTIHTVFADPPFNLRKDYGNGFEDNLDDDEYIDWCHAWIEQCCRVLVDGGTLFVYSLPKWAFHLATFLDQHGMEFRHWIAVTMKGTFPRGKKLYPAHYALLYFTKGEPRVFNRIRVPIAVCRHCSKDIKDYGGHKKSLHPDGISLSDLWEDTSPNRHKRTKFRKGVNELNSMIPERAIEISTNKGDIILDPFGGGGSTFEQAETLGRKWVGIEIGDGGIIRQRLERSCVNTSLCRLPTGFDGVFDHQVEIAESKLSAG